MYAYALDGKVHKYNAATGTETTTGGWPVVSTLKTQSEKGAAALSTATTGGKTYLYSVTDGYIGDGNDYQGHVTTIDLSDATFTVFNSECSNLTYHFVQNGTTTGGSPTDCPSQQNGIWGRPGAVFDAGTQRVFVSTGNGPYDPTGTSKNAGIVWGDSVLALHPNGTGTGSNGLPVDSYTPTTFQNLQNTDADLGSASIALIPAPSGTSAQYLHIGAQVGKDGCVRLINLADMSGQGGAGHTGGELDKLDFPGGSNCASGNDNPELKPQPAVWVNPTDGSSWFYVMSYNNGGAAYKITLSAGNRNCRSNGRQVRAAARRSSPMAPSISCRATTSIAKDGVTGTTIWTSPTTNGGLHWQSLILANGKHLHGRQQQQTVGLRARRHFQRQVRLNRRVGAYGAACFIGMALMPASASVFCAASVSLAFAYGPTITRFHVLPLTDTLCTLAMMPSKAIFALASSAVFESP